jgi:hypothetical protein
MTAFDRALALLAEQAPRTVERMVQNGAAALSADDSHFWSRVRRICGEEYVGRDLATIRDEVNAIRDHEIARHRANSWTYDLNRHMAALQLVAAVNERMARRVQVEKYGRSYL